MRKKSGRQKGGSKKINVEIAPGNRRKLEAYIADYNARPDRKTPKVKYTDVLNDALDKFLDARLPALRGRLNPESGARHAKGKKE